MRCSKCLVFISVVFLFMAKDGLRAEGWCNVLDDEPCSNFYPENDPYFQCFGQECDIVETYFASTSGNPVYVGECPPENHDIEILDSDATVIREAFEGESGNTYYGPGSPPALYACTESRPCDTDCWDLADGSICRSDLNVAYTPDLGFWMPIPLGSGCTVYNP